MFVTGGTGFLGPWLIEKLIDAGAEVVALVRDINSRSRFFTDGIDSRVSMIFGDVTDVDLMRRTLVEYEITHVAHMASQSIVGASRLDPVSTFRTNIGGTWALLDACRALPNLQGVLVGSSDKAYGKPTVLPCTEETAGRPAHPYDASKACMELVAGSYLRTYGVPIVISRAANLFGGGDFNENRIVPSVVLAALQNRRPVIRSDGSPVRDYLYIEDAVDGLVTLLGAAQRDDVCGEAFNFTSGTPLSVLELTGLILEIIGKPELAPDILDNAQSEVDRIYISPRKTAEVLGWNATHTMREGLAETIAWYEKRLKR